MRAWMIGAALGVAAADGAGAQMVDAARPQSVVAAMELAGYRTVLETLPEGTTAIRSSANGMGFSVYFDDCNAPGRGCKSLVFMAWYETRPSWTIQRVNQWNSEKKFLRAYIDRDGDLRADYWLTTVGGLTQGNFADALDWFVSGAAALVRWLDGEAD